MAVEMVRINTRVSKKMNDWLEKEMADTGVPKSTLIYLALEQYVQQKEAADVLGQIVQKIETLENKIEKNKG